MERNPRAGFQKDLETVWQFGFVFWFFGGCFFFSKEANRTSGHENRGKRAGVKSENCPEGKTECCGLRADPGRRPGVAAGSARREAGGGFGGSWGQVTEVFR